MLLLVERGRSPSCTTTTWPRPVSRAALPRVVARHEPGEQEQGRRHGAGEVAQLEQVTLHASRWRTARPCGTTTARANSTLGPLRPRPSTSSTISISSGQRRGDLLHRAVGVVAEHGPDQVGADGVDRDRAAERRAAGARLSGHKPSLRLLYAANWPRTNASSGKQMHHDDRHGRQPAEVQPPPRRRLVRAAATRQPRTRPAGR